METLGRYQIIEEIGHGAMGIVYKGIDPKINRIVALKCLRANLLEGREGAGRRFQLEMRALGRLIHPNIVTIFDAGEEEESGQAYIVMEYVEGISLAQLIKQGRSLSIDQAVQIVIQICRGLDFAHSKEVIHRDIKPGNILLSDDLQTAKITDFGIARLDNTALTQTDRLTGTPHYMSPEQCRGEELDGRSDLFAVGALLYELLTRQKAFVGDSIATVMHQVLHTSPYPPALVDGTIPETISSVAMQALEKEVDDRFGSGQEMAEALSTAAEASGTLYSSNKSEYQSLTKTFTLGNESNPTETEVFDEEKAKPGLRPRYALYLSVFLIALGAVFFAMRRSPAPISTVTSEAPAPKNLKTTEGTAVSATPKNEASPRPTASAGAPAEMITEGQVVFSTLPSGAELVIDGVSKGFSPLSLQLASGPHELRVAKDGFHDLEATLDVPAGEQIPVHLKLIEEE